MKIKTLFLATAALAALASCSNDETVDVNQGSGIRMKAFFKGADIEQDHHKDHAG